MTWTAQSEMGDWTAIPRISEEPTNREKLQAACEMREYVGWGWSGCSEFIELVRVMEPIRIHHTAGEEALDRSDGEWNDYYEETDDGELLGWVVR